MTDTTTTTVPGAWMLAAVQALLLADQDPRRAEAQARLQHIEPHQLGELLDVLAAHPPHIREDLLGRGDLLTVCRRLGEQNQHAHNRALVEGIVPVRYAGAGPADLPLVLRCLESPSPRVRAEAARVAASWIDCPDGTDAMLQAADAAARRLDMAEQDPEAGEALLALVLRAYARARQGA